MDKQELSQKLDTIIVSRLFGTGRWLVDRESSAALSRTLSSMKVQEDVPGETGTTRITALGAGVNFGLLEVFMGYLWEWDIPDVLKKNKLIDELEVDVIYDALESGIDPETVLRGRVQRAYFDYHNPRGTRQ
jgi:hypothetical protein